MFYDPNDTMQIIKEGLFYQEDLLCYANKNKHHSSKCNQRQPVNSTQQTQHSPVHYCLLN